MEYANRAIAIHNAIYFTAWKGCMDVVKHWCRNVQQFKKMFAIVQERKATACKE
uniref:Uncharacterized protein n=1 Tax=Magallana gigas TaxID=29159 RepID=K1Q4K0_MAGGI